MMDANIVWAGAGHWEYYFAKPGDKHPYSLVLKNYTIKEYRW